MRTIFINRKDQNFTETVDEFDYNTIEQKKEAFRCLNEYRIADQQGLYYLSQRSTKEWNN